MKINNRKHKQDYQYSISLKLHIIVDIRGICRRIYLSTQNSIIFHAKRNALCARWLLICQLTLANVWNVYWPNVVSTLYVQHGLRWRNVAPTCWPYDGPTSKLVKLSWSTLGQRSGQPKYSIGPTLSCYLGECCSIVLNEVAFLLTRS